jgi:glutaredoxin
MKTARTPFPAWTLRTLTAAAALVAAAAAPSAHALFKVVGPDGRISYTDRAPETGRVTPVNQSTTGAPEVPMSYATRQASQRFPVTLYSADGCEPCNDARQLLSRRGIPFQERTLITPEDKEAMKQQVGSTGLPLLKVGGQTIPGYSVQAWNETLDVAGYPAIGKAAPMAKQADAKPIAPRAAPKAKAVDPQDAPAPTQAAPAGRGGIRF